jgi:glutamyl-tRNA synthetase
MDKKEIRVRFAPSPTGPLHIGGVRTALYNYLFAKKHGGKIILRIEDTDQQRYVSGAEEYILESLNWCGIHFDEDVRKGGEYGPYRQSERREIYREYAELLVSKGFAYYAFDTEAELEAMRSRANPAEANAGQYGPATRMSMKNALTLPEEEVQKRLRDNEPHVIRIRIPENEVIRFNDLIRGEISVQSANLDDKVLFKSDGWPTYHLANIVDDHIMKVTHVIRGEEWLPSAPLHVLLYRCFGWEETMPMFAHLPLLLKPDGNGKLSKRDGDRLGFPVFPLEWTDPSTGEKSSGYRESGYLPEAFINMLAFLGWNPGTEQEIYTMEQLIDDFSLERVGKHGSKFDPEKAKWFNHQFMQRKSNGELAELLKLSAVFSQQSAVSSRQSVDSGFVEEVCGLIKDRIVLIPDLWKNASFFFIPPDSFAEQDVKKLWKTETSELVGSFAADAKQLTEWTKDSIHELVEKFVAGRQVKTGQLMTPLRLLVVGSIQGPGMMDILEVLGREESVGRIQRGRKIADEMMR